MADNYHRYQAVKDFLMFLPGKIIDVEVCGYIFSHAGLRFTCDRALEFSGQTVTVKILYHYETKKFFALQEVDDEWITWREGLIAQQRPTEAY